MVTSFKNNFENYARDAGDKRMFNNKGTENHRTK